MPCARPLLAALLLALGPAGSAQADPFSLTVLTYNVAGLPEGISGSSPSVNHPQISPLLNAYDLVLVQEDFVYHELLVADLEHPHQSIKDDSLGQLGTGFGDGLNTFSQLPFTGFTRVTWDECFGVLTNASDCLTPKGLSFQRHVLAPGTFLDVYNWHADAGNDEEDRAARRSNTRQLYAEIAARSAGHAVLVLGDTNSRYTRDGDVLPEMLDAVDLTDVWIELERAGEIPPIGPSLNQGCTTNSSGGDCERVDKIMYRSSEWVQLTLLEHAVLDELFSDALGEPLSDHDPVYARFEVFVAPEPGALGGAAAPGALLALARRARRAPRLLRA
jgi:hypothetical protein